ncbi:MAG: hypothetical protein QOI73_990 [Solirubrobacteraceae bacterium]|nr:hypothetical protein [Solirubrobacteraceae bacterium]
MGTLITIAVCWIAASYVVGIWTVVDQLRRPLDDWETAGRDRRFWISLALIAGFHGLGQYATAAYLVGVRPRFRGDRQADGRHPLRRMNAAFSRRWQPAEADVAGRWQVANRRRPTTAAEELALLAAVLIFASSLIHAVVTAVHFEEYWLFGALFALTTCLQAGWTALVYGAQLVTRGLLVAGAVGNAALAVVWTLSRTAGLPIGPHPWRPEAVGAVDVLSTLDELIAVVLLMAAIACLRSRRPSISPVTMRLGAAITGWLFLLSVLSPFAGGHHH